MAWAMVAVGGVMAIGGIVGESIASGNAADAQENIASEQNRMAMYVLEQQRADRERALGLAAPSMDELRMISRQYQMSEQALAAQLASIKQDEDLLHSVDPALKEAGKQAYDMLQGKEAAALAPLRAERARQKETLKATLRDQLGAGYATSSAGIEAMQAFERESAGLSADVQNQTLGAFLGVAASVRPDVSGKLGRAYGTSSQMMSTALAGQQNVAGRQVAAFTGNAPNYQNVINTAGSQYVGELGKSQAMGNMFGQIGQIGGMAAGYGMQRNQMDYAYKNYGAVPRMGYNVNSGNPQIMNPTGFQSGFQPIPSSYVGPTR